MGKQYYKKIVKWEDEENPSGLFLTFLVGVAVGACLIFLILLIHDKASIGFEIFLFIIIIFLIYMAITSNKKRVVRYIKEKEGVK